MDEYTHQLNKLRDELFTKAKENIKAAQLRMKKDYDRKNGRVKVLILVPYLYTTALVLRFHHNITYASALNTCVHAYTGYNR